jgi:tetratricopeptide (TPR) repeat protein
MDAKQTLLRAALIDRSPETESLSIHRLIQKAVIRQLSKQEREKYFGYALALLRTIFPTSWRHGPGGDYSYVYSAWETCEKCLPHVAFLASQYQAFKLQTRDLNDFTDLLTRCAWWVSRISTLQTMLTIIRYLYEAERYVEAEGMVSLALQSITEKESLDYARLINLLGLLHLDMNRPTDALECFTRGLKIRETILDPDAALLTSSYSNLGLAYTELADFENALEYSNKALGIRLRTDSDKVGNSYSNISSCLLRMGKPDEAEDTLAKCPSLKDMKDEAFLRTTNPRFSRSVLQSTSILDY